MPEIWLLGSGERSAALAAHFGLGFSSAHFINEHGEGVAKAYQEQFQPSSIAPQPQTSLGVFAICADTEEEAKHLAATRDLWRLRLGQGIRKPFPTPQEALAYPYTAEEKIAVDANNRRHIIGTADQVKARIDELAAAYNADEVFVVSITHDHDARVKSYALLAEAYGLTPR